MDWWMWFVVIFIPMLFGFVLGHGATQAGYERASREIKSQMEPLLESLDKLLGRNESHHSVRQMRLTPEQASRLFGAMKEQIETDPDDFERFLKELKDEQ